jgi:hypothetical protein
MNKQNSFITVFATLFVVVALFQNCGGSDFNVGEYTNSSTGALTAPAIAPDIISKSTDLALNAGQPALFTVSTSGSSPMTYAWYKNGNLISGAVESSYFLATTVAGDSGTYAVSATNSAGSASTTFQLTVMATPPPPPPVNAPPVITSSPTPYLYILRTETIRLQVVATGTGLTYQWFFKPVNSTASTAIAGATSSVYSKVAARPIDSGTYTVVVTNAGGSLSASSEVEVDFELPGEVDTR